MKIRDVRKIQNRRFECLECGNVTLAPKIRGRTKLGHIKTMWCYKCEMICNHIQIGDEKMWAEIIGE